MIGNEPTEDQIISWREAADYDGETEYYDDETEYYEDE